MKTIIFDINKDPKLLKKSALGVKKGKIAVFATDTVYGIGTNVLDKKAVSKIYKLKKRPTAKPMPLLLYSLAQAKKIVQWNENAQKLAKKFLPGALTLILKCKMSLPSGLCLPKQSTVKCRLAIRIPNHKKLLKWLKLIDVPLACTSANLSGKPAMIKESKVIKQFKGKVDYILTGGDLKATESTVVDLTYKKPAVLREREITAAKIKKAVLK